MTLFVLSATALALMWVPGFLLVPTSARPPLGDPIARFALRTGIGMAVWPILILWTSLAGITWSIAVARGTALAMALIAVFVAARLRGKWRPRSESRSRLAWIVFAIVIALTIWTRVEQIRGLALPAWVDPVHHTMVIRLLVENGAVPDTYAPFLGDATFYYHWGYHALVAILAWVLGATGAFEIAALELHSGQFLNALTPLMVYAGAWTLFRSRWAAVGAAMLASLLSFYPAYYVSWGRYTHLTGVLLLPIVGVALWLVHRKPGARTAIVAVVLASGLLLIHVRVALFAATFAAVLGAWLLIRRRWRTPLCWIGIAAAVALVVAPWFATILGDSTAKQILDPSSASAPAQWTTPGEVPPDLLLAPRNRILFSLATAGLAGIAGFFSMPAAGRIASAAFWVALLIAAFRSHVPVRTTRRTGWALLLLAGWTALTACLLFLSGPRFSLPQIASPASGVITGFLPAALAGGGILVWGTRALLGARARSALAILIVGGSIVAAWGMRQVVNPVTILAGPNDLAAIRWIAANTPTGAVFAADSQPWIGGARVGRDGGYWIGVLTGRRSLPPPALYYWSLRAEEIERIHAALDAVGTANLDDGARLEEFGVTHLFVGEKSSPAWRAAVAAIPAELLFQSGAVQVLRVKRIGAGAREPRPR